VAGALLETRGAFRDGRWDALKDLLLVVTGFDGSRAMKHGGGTGGAGPTLRMAGTMRSRTSSVDPSVAGAVPLATAERRAVKDLSAERVDVLVAVEDDETSAGAASATAALARSTAFWARSRC
jgi:hypothetical protein